MNGETVKLSVGGVELAIPEAILSVMVAENLASKGRNPYIPGEGIWVLVDGSKVDKGLFAKCDMKTYKQDDLLWNIRKAGVHEGRYDNKKFYIMVPPITWPADEGKTLEQLEEIAKSYGGRVAYEYEVLLYFAMCLSNGVTWEEFCDVPDKSPCFRVCLNNWQKLVRVGGSTLALENGIFKDHANNPFYKIGEVELPGCWKEYCTSPYIVIPYKEKKNQEV